MDNPPPKVGPGPGQTCHELIKATAIEMAGELYDILATNNQQYAEWKRMNPRLNTVQLEIAFIEAKWPQLVEDARATLASMLARPIDESLKARIHDALVKDHALRNARAVRRASQQGTIH